jgi:hypothetical protein
MRTKTSILGLILVLAFGAYLESPFSFLNLKYSYTADQPVMAQPVKVEEPSNVPDVIDKLEKKKKEDGYIVETYQEYEIYKDKEGNITKEVPTGRTDTLQYWDYSEDQK